MRPATSGPRIVRKSASGEDLEKLEEFEAKIRETMRNDRPLKREGTAEDVAEAALYFATDRSRYVTGTVLPVDGGTVAGKVIAAQDSTVRATAAREDRYLNQSLDLIACGALTERVTTARAVRADRASSTQEAILKAAERLYAEHGVFAVSNRQVSEAAGQGNNAAVGYHFGTKTDLVRAIEQKHRASDRAAARADGGRHRRLHRAAGLGRLHGVLADRAPGAARQPDLVRAVRRAGDGRSRLPEDRRPATRSRRRRWSRSSTASPAACPSCRWLS